MRLKYAEPDKQVLNKLLGTFFVVILLFVLKIYNITLYNIILLKEDKDDKNKKEKRINIVDEKSIWFRIYFLKHQLIYYLIDHDDYLELIKHKSYGPVESTNIPRNPIKLARYLLQEKKKG